MSPSDPVELARSLVVPLVPDDLTEVDGDEDLRDYGLDSVRAMQLLAAVRERGGEIEYADLVGGPTLDILAGALAPTLTPGGDR